jgi:hypothetical protein
MRLPGAAARRGFLTEDELPPDESSIASHQSTADDGRPTTDDCLSQEELLKKPVYIPFRAKKDPRDLKILDPACGSGHFLLYAFDLLGTIYEEAWEDDSSPSSEATGCRLRDDYATFEGLRRVLPGLVLRHNLYGIDIDPRAAQIAALALWMRAQRAFNDFGILRGKRPPIAKTNIVVAEPMPGEKELRQEFVASLDKQLGRLVERVFEKMELAGEAGSLLKIEDEIQAAIREIYGETGDLFRKSDEDRWRTAESELLHALRTYAEQAQDGRSYRRRLFAEDVARGFSLTDICRQRHDVVLMNPPFGEASRQGKQYVRQKFPVSQNDIFAAFVERGLGMLASGGRLGAITSRTGFFITSLREWRRRVLFDWSRLEFFADLGEGVMDSAVVEAAAYCLQQGNASLPPVAFRVLTFDDQQDELNNAVLGLRRGLASTSTYAPKMRDLSQLPEAPLAYWLDSQSISVLTAWPSYEPSAGDVRKGLRTGDNFRFVRALWEVEPCLFSTDGTAGRSVSVDGWVPLVMTGAIQPWFSPMLVALNWRSGAAELRAYVTKYGSSSRLIQSEDYYFRPGFSWTRRAVRFVPYLVPRGCIFTGSRPMAFPRNAMEVLSVAVFASRIASAFLRIYGEKFAWPNFLEGKLKLLPWPTVHQTLRKKLEAFVEEQYATWRSSYRYHEPFHEFVGPHLEIEDEPATNGTLKFDLSSLLSPELEDGIRSAYGFDGKTAALAERDLTEVLEARRPSFVGDRDDDSGAEDERELVVVDTPETRAAGLMSYAVGCVFGRWDIRYVLNPELAPRPVNASEPLTKAPAGMLVNRQGLPVSCSEVPNDYPLAIAWDGIRVLDQGHAGDLEAAVQAVLVQLYDKQVAHTEPTLLRNLPGNTANDGLS